MSSLPLLEAFDYLVSVLVELIFISGIVLGTVLGLALFGYLGIAAADRIRNLDYGGFLWSLIGLIFWLILSYLGALAEITTLGEDSGALPAILAFSGLFVCFIFAGLWNISGEGVE